MVNSDVIFLTTSKNDILIDETTNYPKSTGTVLGNAVFMLLMI